MASCLQEVATSQLGEGEATVGLGAYSRDLDLLLYQVSERFGTPMIAEVSENGDALNV